MLVRTKTVSQKVHIPNELIVKYHDNFSLFNVNLIFSPFLLSDLPFVAGKPVE